MVICHHDHDHWGYDLPSMLCSGQLGDIGRHCSGPSGRVGGITYPPSVAHESFADDFQLLDVIASHA